MPAPPHDDSSAGYVSINLQHVGVASKNGTMDDFSDDALPDGIPDYVFTADDDETGLTPAHAAATTIIMRDGAADAPEILMVKRSAKMAFAAGMAVFPGGRVDPADHALAADIAGAHAISATDAAARIAAIRETIEETGLGIGIAGDVDHATLAVWRTALLADARLGDLVAAAGVSLDLAALEPFARWRPTFAHARTFDTRFYVALASSDTPSLSVIEAENSALFWITARDALAQADAGVIDVIFPTRRNLERIAGFASHAEAVVSARQFGAPRITPYLSLRDGARHLCIRDDCGYPVTSEAMGSAMRG